MEESDLSQLTLINTKSIIDPFHSLSLPDLAILQEEEVGGISVMSATQWRQAGLNYRLTVTRETTRGLHRFYVLQCL